MHKLAFVCGFIALASTAVADGGKTGATLLVPTDLKWTDIPNRPGAKIAVVEGDPKAGPSHFYLKYDRGFDGGLHHHTSDHGGYILSGTVIITVDGKETRLPPGSFFFIDGKKPHAVKCDPSGDCLMAVDVRGKWDVIADSPPKATTSKK